MRILIVFLIFQLTLFADSFFVRYNPSVTGNGTAANPWGTLEDIDWKHIPDSSSIHLKGTFKQQRGDNTLLNIPNKSGKDIVFKAWDENNKPVFDGDGEKPSRFGVEIRKADYISFEDITFKNFSQNPVFIQGTNGQRVTGITLRRCTFDPLKIKGSTPGGTSYAAIFIKYAEDSKIDTCTINYVYDNPVLAQTDGVYSQDNINNHYVGNTIHIKNSIDDQTYHIDGIQSYKDEELKIEKNSVYNESSSFGTHQNRQGVYINTVKALDLGNNNIVLEDGSSAIGVHPDKCFIAIKIYNNTLVNSSSAGQQLYIEFPEMNNCNDSKSFQVYNNIFYKQGHSADVNPVAVKLQNVDKDLIVFNNNLYYNTASPTKVKFEEYGNGSNGSLDFSSWKVAGRDRQGDIGDPNFALTNGIEHVLTDKSDKCLDKGALMGVSEDLFSVVRPQGAGIDLGAFEYNGSNLSPKEQGQQETLSLANYPNPFNPQTLINFNLSKEAHVKLIIYDILGQVVTELLNDNMTAGNHSISFNAQGLASGVYVYSIEVLEPEGIKMFSSKKMIVNK